MKNRFTKLAIAALSAGAAVGVQARPAISWSSLRMPAPVSRVINTRSARFAHLCEPTLTGQEVSQARSLSGLYASVGGQSPVKESIGLQPQVELAGTGIATLDIGEEGIFGGRGVGSQSQVNFADSSLTAGVSERLYHGAIGSLALGGLTVDESNTGNGVQMFLHQAYMDYEDLKFEAYVGRTNTPTSQVVQFPTLREDDLVDFTSVLNPFSNGVNSEEHLYSNVAAVVFNQGLHQFIDFHAQHLIDSAGVGSNGSGLNSAGVTYRYLGNPALTSVEKVPSWGVGFETRSLTSAAGGASNVAYLGGTLNLKPSITHKLDLRLLAQASFGNSTNSFTSLNDSYRADQQSIALSIRSLESPFGRPSSQWALTAGYKRYSKITDANSTGFALSYFKSLGDGFDLVSQLGYERRSAAMAMAFGGKTEATVFQIGLSFNFGSTYNQQVGPRRSPTNLMHKYIPN